MEYRAFSGIEQKISLLGFGCMRFPTRKTDGKIAVRAAKKLIDMAFDGGVTYFDTAYFYHGGGSEGFVNQALAGRARDSYVLTSKLPTVLIKSLEDARRIYAEQRERLQRDSLDFYLFHNMNLERWNLMRETGVFDWMLELRRQGQFQKLGFSFHGSYEDFQAVLSGYDWDVCQLQLNYMDTEEQAGIRGYQLAAERGVPVIVMEPVKGGSLADPPQEVRALLDSLGPGPTPSSWALRWAGSLPGVLTVLSGMTTPEQVADNLATFGAFQALTDREQAVVAQAAEAFRSRVNNGCTDCKYCMPCPAGVNIPQNFALWNRYAMYGPREIARRWADLDEKEKGRHCVGCAQCEVACPQKLPIRDHLKQVEQAMEGLWI